jgi:membrane protease YdiL (CAAX protease family)
LITSAIFALLHFLVGFDPSRLAVFFPSLLFGWLYVRTGGILAPVLVHAACNLLVAFASTQYLPA